MSYFPRIASPLSPGCCGADSGMPGTEGVLLIAESLPCMGNSLLTNPETVPNYLSVRASTST